MFLMSIWNCWSSSFGILDITWLYTPSGGWWAQVCLWYGNCNAGCCSEACFCWKATSSCKHWGRDRGIEIWAGRVLCWVECLGNNTVPNNTQITIQSSILFFYIRTVWWFLDFSMPDQREAQEVLGLDAAKGRQVKIPYQGTEDQMRRWSSSRSVTWSNAISYNSEH